MKKLLLSFLCLVLGHRWSWRKVVVKQAGMSVRRECLRCGAQKGLTQ